MSTRNDEVLTSLAVSSRRALATRRMTLLTVAQNHRTRAATYKAQGLYSVAARETIAAARVEDKARRLTVWSLTSDEV